MAVQKEVRCTLRGSKLLRQKQLTASEVKYAIVEIMRNH